MNKAIRFVFMILCIICLQLIIGITVIKPLIFTCGSTDQEVTMSMPGDHLTPFISSTRSVTINSPISEVWDWLIQSYEFEKTVSFYRDIIGLKERKLSSSTK